MLRVFQSFQKTQRNIAANSKHSTISIRYTQTGNSASREEPLLILILNDCQLEFCANRWTQAEHMQGAPNSRDATRPNVIPSIITGWKKKIWMSVCLKIRDLNGNLWVGNRVHVYRIPLALFSGLASLLSSCLLGIKKWFTESTVVWLFLQELPSAWLWNTQQAMQLYWAQGRGFKCSLIFPYKGEYLLNIVFIP